MLSYLHYVVTYVSHFLSLFKLQGTLMFLATKQTDTVLLLAQIYSF